MSIERGSRAHASHRAETAGDRPHPPGGPGRRPPAAPGHPGHPPKSPPTISLCRAVQAAKYRPRVRKELRTLSTAEYRALIVGLSTLTAVPTSAGRALFGAQYVSYNEMLMKHAVAVNDPRGDQASC